MEKYSDWRSDVWRFDMPAGYEISVTDYITVHRRRIASKLPSKSSLHPEDEVLASPERDARCRQALLLKLMVKTGMRAAEVEEILANAEADFDRTRPDRE